jgi:TPR repeat protein
VAIASDFPPAYNALAGIYFRGDGVPIDLRRALDLWLRGGALGHLPAKRNLLQQRLRGRYGFWARVVAAVAVLPVAFEIATVSRTSRFTDRLR